MDQETRREVDGLKQGTTFAAGTFELTHSSASNTTITRVGVSTGSVVHVSAYGSNAANSAITRVVPAKGSFTVYHSVSSATGRVYRYSFVTPQS